MGGSRCLGLRIKYISASPWHVTSTRQIMETIMIDAIVVAVLSLEGISRIISPKSFMLCGEETETQEY